VTKEQAGFAADSGGPEESIPEREQQLAAAIAEFVDLQTAAEAIDIDAFCRRFPHLDPDLRAGIDALHSLDRMMLPEEEPGEIAVPPDVPEKLSGHRILSEIGAGGMARVFLAADERLGRKVAIKMLNERYSGNELVRTRFMREARALARLSHPNVVRIYNLGQPDEPPHFVMEYLEGAPLTDAARALDLRQKVQLMQKFASAVHFLHQHQIIHRDLKPGNILVGMDLEPKLLDFGLARHAEGLESTISTDGEVLGTPQYFSPEQARGDADLDARSDIFSLGTVMYEMLTGTLPFRADTFGAQVRSICDEEPALPRRLSSAIPGDLQNVCMKALEKKPVRSLCDRARNGGRPRTVPGRRTGARGPEFVRAPDGRQDRPAPARAGGLEARPHSFGL